MDCIFACDAGTSALKAALVSPVGNLFTEKRFPLSASPSAAEYVQALQAALRLCRQVAERDKLRIAGICISGNGPSLVAVAKSQCKKLSPAKGHTESLNDKLLLWSENPLNVQRLSDSERCFFEMLQSSGSIFLPRIFLFSQKYTAAVQNASLLLPLPEYLSFTLTGNPICFLPEARYQNAYWLPTQLKILDDFFAKSEECRSRNFSVSDKIPPFALTGSIVGQFDSIPVIAGAPDFFAAIAGTKTITPLSACDRAGTTEGINVCLAQKPEVSSPCRILPSVNASNWNASMLLGKTGQFADRFDKLGEAFLSSAELSAFFEKLNRAIAALEALSGSRLTFTLSGGQANNQRWNQLKAERTQRSFLLPQTVNGELLGDAAFGFTALHYFSDITSASENLVTIAQVYQ